MDLPGYGGCIAGDDTVFCAIREGGDEKALMDRIQQVLAKR
jgi:arginine repressor